MSSNPFTINTTLNIKPSRTDLKKLQKDIESALDSMPADKFDKSMANVALRLKKAYMEAEKLNTKMEQIRSGQIKTAEFKSLEKDLRQAQVEAGKLRKQLNSMSTYDPDRPQIERELQGRIQEIAEIEDIMERYMEVDVDKSPEMERTRAAADLLNDRINILLSDFYKLGEEGSESTEQAAQGTSDFKNEANNLAKEMLRSIGIFAKYAARLAAIPFKAAAAGAKKLASALINIAKQKISKLFPHKDLDNFNRSLGGGIRKLFKYGLGILSLAVLFRKLRGVIKEGIDSLVQYDKNLNASVSSMTSALKQLKYSLATAFAPIIKVAAPYITYLIKLINRAIDAVGQFLAALTGQKTYTKVAEVQEDYAKSLQDTTKETKKAKKAAEGYLSPLDEINRLESDKTDNTADIGGADAGNSAQKVNYEQVPINSKFQEMAQKLKDFIKNEDWEGLGAYIASGINKGMQKIYDTINWDKVGPKITKFVNAFTTTFNSLVDHIDWKLMGKTIGAGLNTVIYTLNLLLEGIDWVNLGKKFGDGLHSLLTEFDAKAFGNLLGNKFMVIPKIVYGLVLKMEKNKTWKLAGKKFGDAINGLFEKVNLGMIGTTIGKIFTGIGSSLLNAAKTIKWADIGSNIASGINNLFKNLDVGQLVDGIYNFINGLLTTLEKVIQETDWGVVVQKIIEFIVKAGIAIIKLGVRLIEIAFELVAALGKGIVDAIVNTDWGAIWGKIVDGIKSFFGIGDGKSSKFLEFGKSMMTGLVTGIGSLVGSVVDLFKGLKDKIVEKWNSLKESTKEKWNSIKSKVSTVSSELATSVKEKWGTIKSHIGTALDGMKQKNSERWSQIKENTSKAWSWFKQNGPSIFSTMVSKILGFWNKLKEGTSKVWNAIITIVKKPINAIIGFINAMIRGVVSGINAVTGMLNNLQIDIPDWAGGGTLGFNLPTFTAPQIPLLAKGAIIPPNNAFMAVLGDQKQGTNIEAPEELIRKIVREESQNAGNNTYRIILEVGGRQLLEAVLSEADLKKHRSGTNPFALA